MPAAVNIPRLAFAYLAARPLATALNVLLLALGLGTMVLLLLFTSQAEERLARDAKPVDLVVGAKGSPLQLILSAVLHADVPTGNIPLRRGQRSRRQPDGRAGRPGMRSATASAAIASSVPSLRTSRSTSAKLESGRMFEHDMDVVLGAEVARKTGLAAGAQFVGTHGLSSGGAAHGRHPFKVVGVLAPTGTRGRPPRPHAARKRVGRA